MAFLIGDFAPDRSRYAPGSTSVMVNVIPSIDGVSPMPGLIAFTDPLPDTCLGGIGVRTVLGAWEFYAGTRTKLYKLDTTDYSWTEVTRASGGDYSVPEGDRWSFTVFKEKLVANQITDDVQYIEIGVGTNFAALPGSPPKAKYSWATHQQLMLGNLVDAPNDVIGSVYGNAEDWTLQEGGCSRETFPDGYEVMGGFGYENYSVVFQRNRIRQLVSSFDTAGFTATIINPARGAISPLCIVPIGRGEYLYLAEDGFYIWNGQSDDPVGLNRVNRWFLGDDGSDSSSDVDRENIADVKGFLDPFRQVVIITYPKADDTTGVLGLAYLLAGSDQRRGRWFTSDVGVTEMISFATPGVSIDGMDAFYASIDAATLPFDSRALMGGKPTIGAFNTDNELCFFSGENMAGTVESFTRQLSPGSRSLLQELGLEGDIDAEDITIEVGTTDRKGVAVTYGSAVSCETDGSGLFKVRADGRLHRVRFNIPAGTVWHSLAGTNDEESRWVATGRR